MCKYRICRQVVHSHLLTSFILLILKYLYQARLLTETWQTQGTRAMLPTLPAF